MSATNFKGFFFESLPSYFKLADQGKITDEESQETGQGFLERYLSIYPDELQDIKDPIDTLPSLLDPMTVPQEFLSLMGAVYGFPPSLTLSDPIFRKVLNNIVQVYKSRGTSEGVSKFFKAFGVYPVEVTMVDGAEVNFDDGKTHDSDPPVEYDTNRAYCVSCKLTITDPDEILIGLGQTTPPPELLETLRKALAFLLPISCSLTEIEYGEFTHEFS